MRLQADSALRDREIAEALLEDPGLLAIVDALHCTQQPRTRRQVRFAPLLVAAAAVLAAVLALVAPWQSRAGIVSRALAAVGTQPVVHVVTERPLASTSILDLKTGKLVRASIRTEVYFDAGRELERTLAFSVLTGLTDELHTASGDWENGSPIYSCAWIAAHPAAAARARVSCPSGASTRPQPPRLDPALAAFASGYQAALRSGKARSEGNGTVAGRPVHWLKIGNTERVAIDASSLLPVLVRESAGGHTMSYRVLSFTTEPYASTDFVRAKPPANPTPVGQSVEGGQPISITAAHRTLGALALPAASSKLRLSRAFLYHLSAIYAGKGPSRRTVEVGLFYPAGASSIVLYESRQPNMVAGFPPAAPTASRGALIRHNVPSDFPPPDRDRDDIPAIRPFPPWQAVLRLGDLYVTVDAWSQSQLLHVARTLEKR